MDIGFYFIFRVLSYALCVFIIAKIFTEDYKPIVKEIIYFVLVSLFMTFVYIHFFEVLARSYNFFFDSTFLVFLFLYFYKGKSYTFQESIALSAITLLVSVISFVIAQAFIFILRLFVSHPFSYWLSMLLLYSLAIIIAVLALWFTRSMLKFMFSTPRLRNISVIISSVSYIAALFLGYSIHMSDLEQIISGERITANLGTLEILALTYILLNFIVTVTIIKFTESKITLQQKESEQMALQLYIDEIEQHNISTQKFEHDYRNILLTIDGFINDDDMSGLKQYYHSNLKKAYDTAVYNRFALKNLNRIRVIEIKSLLSAKLIFAQQNGIKVTFDANSDIEAFPIDSITLARILGILLDNAIEALTELGNGELLVSFFKTDSEVTLVVQNTCSPDTPPIMGLKILSEIIDRIPNITREMSTNDNKFTQKIIIQERCL